MEKQVTPLPLLQHFGYGGHQLGYYAGFLAASFCGAQLTSSIFWGMISDKYGRKPAVVFGTFGAGIGMLVFGMATTYKQAVLGRLLSGFLSGNIGIIKSFLTEITDNTNRAKGFSYLQVAWAMGSILGPLIGGFLCYPSTKYSNIFPSGSIFDHRPFFLPCLVCVIQNIFSTIIVIAFMKEPQRKNKQIKKIESSNRGISSGKDGIESRQSFTQSVSNNLAYALSSIKSTWSAVVSYLLEREDEGIEYSPVSLDASVHNAVSRAGQQGSTDASEYNDDMDVSTHKDNDIQSSKDEGEMEMIRLDDSTISDMDSSSHPIIFDSSTSNDKNGLRRQRSDSSSSHTNSKSVLLDRDVLLTVGCYGILSFGDVITVECIPLLCKLDRSLGGLSLGSSDIGLAMSVGGVSMLIFSSLLLPKILSGSKLQVFRIFNLIGIPVILLFPSLGIICNFLTDGFNLQSEENKYKVLMILLTCAVTIRTLVFTLSFSSIIMLVNHSVDDENLGKVNGFGQTLASTARCVGPALGGGMWSVSLKHRFVFGNFILTAIALLMAEWVSYRLPAALDIKKGSLAGEVSGNDEEVSMQHDFLSVKESEEMDDLESYVVDSDEDKETTIELQALGDEQNV